MTRPSSYEDFRLLAEHPRHRDVPAIFQLEVIETDELEEFLVVKDRKKQYRNFLQNYLYCSFSAVCTFLLFR